MYRVVDDFSNLFLDRDFKMMELNNFMMGGAMVFMLGVGIYLPMILFGWYLSRENRLDRIEMSKRIDDLESRIYFKDKK